MNSKKSLLLILLLISLARLNLFAWTSSNEGICYTMDTLCILSDDISYNAADEMYEVDCDIIILENDTLIILPGEIVKFFSYANPYTVRRGIKIYGCFLAIGLADKRIHLGDPEATFSGNWWNGIEFYNTSLNGESILKYCTLRGVTHIDEYKQTALYCENASPIIDHCTFKYMGSGNLSYGCSAIGIIGQSYPIISYCTFEKIGNGIAVWCNVYTNELFGYVQDTINYPSPLIYGCNIISSVQGFWGWPCEYDIVILYGGFLDNCYLGFGWIYADTTLGNPMDTIGDGICTTTSINEWGEPKFFMVDGVVNPRGDTLLTGISEKEIDILPTTANCLVLKNNYPNPFSNFTIICFEVAKPATIISLTIYDSRGNLVREIIKDKNYNQGNYKADWHGENDSGEKVKEGIYFYKLTSGRQMIVKKAIVVK
jgi:hypothetical protein